ncbi:MAG: hypothetical protein U1C46_11630 [Bacteroidales bacterium]|nr:hypothetical protein [Bacteroidales bacterium]
MKALKLFVTVMAVFLAGSLHAQISVNVNTGSPPLWGPVGYTNVRYYYLPDVEAYYDVPSSRFIYYERGVWVHRKYLPRRYRSYDLYNGYKVVMTDYHGKAPYIHFTEYKMKYAKGYRGHEQKTIGAKPGKGNSPGKILSKGQPNKKAIQDNANNKRKGNGSARGKKR